MKSVLDSKVCLLISVNSERSHWHVVCRFESRQFMFWSAGDESERRGRLPHALPKV